MTATAEITTERNRTTISIDPNLHTRGKRRAREVRRTFSNYIESLIEDDVKAARRTAKA